MSDPFSDELSQGRWTVSDTVIIKNRQREGFDDSVQTNSTDEISVMII